MFTSGSTGWRKNGGAAAGSRASYSGMELASPRFDVSGFGDGRDGVEGSSLPLLRR
jgi:hypothetical protein